VFDGHGGKQAAVYAAHNMFTNFNEQFDAQAEAHSPEQLKAALHRAFVQTDAEFVSVANRNQWDDGTTAVVAVLSGRHLLVANAGDSRAVLYCNDEIIPMSHDHKPESTAERDRIETLGGKVRYSWGLWRVQGVLATSRSLGDRLLKPFVIASPDVREFFLPAELPNAFLVLATDGLWDVMSNQDVQSSIRQWSAKGLSVNKMAEHLAETAFNLGSGDNITVMVADLRKIVQTAQLQSYSKQKKTANVTHTTLAYPSR